MTFKTILVHVHDTRRAKHLLETVVPLANAMDAHLVGLSVLPPYVVIPSMDGAGTTVTVDQHRMAYEQEMVQLKSIFEAATSGRAARSEWREADAGFTTAAGTIIEQSRAADLVVACPQDPAWIYSPMLEAPDRIVIESGRPLLLVPDKAGFTMPPKRVTVAWNARREAARAIADALPLLRRAEDVNVLWINAESERQTAGDLPAAEICTMLARHDVKCRATQATAIGGDVGSELLRQAAAFGSDLLVMGCYGHSRLREFVLGGASRHILQHARIPTLLSH